MCTRTTTTTKTTCRQICQTHGASRHRGVIGPFAARAWWSSCGRARHQKCQENRRVLIPPSPWSLWSRWCRCHCEFRVVLRRHSIPPTKRRRRSEKTRIPQLGRSRCPEPQRPGQYAAELDAVAPAGKVGHVARWLRDAGPVGLQGLPRSRPLARKGVQTVLRTSVSMSGGIPMVCLSSSAILGATANANSSGLALTATQTETTHPGLRHTWCAAKLRRKGAKCPRWATQ
mmetsp:Transcript_17393/g.53956  ORF Transcript_17393/g.53956 Transcript_17393/m.53956 type:complete len:230 (-) Transcript_17393:418-1107(-)